MNKLEKILAGTPPEAREKARLFIEKHGVEAYKKIRTLEAFNFEEAWQAVKECNNEELLLVRMLIKDAYGMTLEEIVKNLKEKGVEKTRVAFMKLKKENKKFGAEEVFNI